MIHRPISLGDIRIAILQSRRMAFTYQKVRVVADFYLLGQAKRTGAYIILAWSVAPEQEWRLLGYSLIRDLEPMGSIDVVRRDFRPEHPKLATVDTVAFNAGRHSLPVVPSH